jgi:hypothetical protein
VALVHNFSFLLVGFAWQLFLSNRVTSSDILTFFKQLCYKFRHIDEKSSFYTGKGCAVQLHMSRGLTIKLRNDGVG